MNVKDLIAALQTMSQDAIVVHMDDQSVYEITTVEGKRMHKDDSYNLTTFEEIPDPKTSTVLTRIRENTPIVDVVELLS